MSDDPLKETIKAAVAEVLGLNGDDDERIDFFRLVVELQQCKKELQHTHEELRNSMQNWEVWYALAKAREEQNGLLQEKMDRLTQQLDCLEARENERG